MGDVALAAVVNLPALTEKLLAAEGAEGAAEGGAAQAAKPALLSAAAALASAASALAGAGKEQAAGAVAAAAEEAAAGAAEVPSAKDVQTLLEEEINAMNRLLDGRWVDGWDGWVVGGAGTLWCCWLLAASARCMPCMLLSGGRLRTRARVCTKQASCAWVLHSFAHRPSLACLPPSTAARCRSTWSRCIWRICSAPSSGCGRPTAAVTRAGAAARSRRE